MLGAQNTANCSLIIISIVMEMRSSNGLPSSPVQLPDIFVHSKPKPVDASDVIHTYTVIACLCEYTR